MTLNATMPTDEPRSAAAVGEAFPHKALSLVDVYPPITLELAGELIATWRRYNERFPGNPYAGHDPAIVFGLFKGPLVKYLCSADEVEGTIANMREALERGE